MANLFGFSINRSKDEQDLKSFVETTSDDGAVVVETGAGGHFTNQYVDMEGSAKSEAELITKYRQMERQPEVSKAIDDIVNDAIVIGDTENPVDINLDTTELSDKVKDIIRDEFSNVLSLLDFSNKGYDLFLRWYVDGRIRYHVVIDEKNPNFGIAELRYVDPRKLRKIKEIENAKDSGDTEATLKKVKNEFWVYSEKGFQSTAANTTGGSNTKGIRISNDSIAEATSGILNETNSLILSHLHKSMRSYNQLKMLEDAAVIYRMSRAPERRVFYIDVGNLPKMKAEQYLRDMMVKHKNRLVYDSTTGEVKDDRKHVTMMEDFWLPRREGGRGTEITTLPGGQNLGEMDDILYFQKNLFKALNVPESRLDGENGFSLGRSSEITRDEVKFSKFINRLRMRFSTLFDVILERQLILKNIITPEEWEDIKNLIKYDFKKDNHFEELKSSEIMRERVQSLQDVESYVGTYFSMEWVRKNILKMSEEDIEQMKEQIESEEEEMPEEEPDQEIESEEEPKEEEPKES